MGTVEPLAKRCEEVGFVVKLLVEEAVRAAVSEALELGGMRLIGLLYGPFTYSDDATRHHSTNMK